MSSTNELKSGYSTKLCDIYAYKHKTDDYDDILNDTTIKGKFKYFINNNSYSFGSSRYDVGSVLVQYLLKFSSIDNTIFSFNSRIGSARNERKKRNKKNNGDPCLKLPNISFKNFECEYKGVKIYISNIFTSKYFHPEVSVTPPGMLILSIDSVCKDHDTFWSAGFLQSVIKESKKWHMTNILGEEYNEDNYSDVFTFTEGFWEFKRGNRVRKRESLFIEEEKYKPLLDKINKFSSDKSREIYNRLNIPYKMNILLHGPPGCGKSSFIEITAHELKRNIRFMQITPKITDEQFSTAISALGESDILVCEDIDCLFVDRKNSDTDKNAMTFSGLLNCFDGINGGKNGLIVFLTTNHKCTLDKALTRPGRVDITVEFSYMNNNTIKNMIKWYFESNYDEEDFNKFYLKIKDYKLTGAIMAQFLLSMVLDEKYALLDNYKLLHSIVKENNYEEDVIKENMYT
tara:strand:- start:4340 stop:5716 length:1377 start_codon:yes stop_codon:yes gene_type:complete